MSSVCGSRPREPVVLMPRSSLENNNQIVSDQGVRKTLYQKVCHVARATYVD